MTQLTARAILDSLHANGNFFTLPFSTLDELHHVAKKHSYHKPANANGSTARYFYAYLLRKAKRTE